ncbi:MAG: DUF1501 domain-containing protein [Planctomycetaceae bacterium]
MLKILGSTKKVCHGLPRREMLQAVGGGLLGVNWFTTQQALAANALAQEDPAPLARAKSVIFLFLFGGPCQLETFDQKPNAPDSIRGPYKPIASRTPGLLISEKLPQLASVSDKFCVVRTMTHQQNDHNACHLIQTGHNMPPAERGAARVGAAENDWPAMGSVVQYLDEHDPSRQKSSLPSYLYVPNRLGHIQGYDRLGQYGGWLGKSYNALATDIRKKDKDDNPYARPCSDEELDFRLKGLSDDPALTLDRLDRRWSLLEQFDTQLTKGNQQQKHEYDDVRQRAWDLVSSTDIRSAFDIRQESASLRDRYGRHLFGQSALLGRRLIEAGARFVTVLWDCPNGYSWDSHGHNNEVNDYLLPGLDQTFSALLTDLEDRGLLDETLIVCMGEMGRTPRGNANWGRDHWGFCFPAVLAGAGIKGGTLYGSSDKDAAYPKDNPVSPADMSATIFQTLGINPNWYMRDAQNRPVPLVEGGKPLEGLFG